jgi:hypothetical protein
VCPADVGQGVHSAQVGISVECDNRGRIPLRLSSFRITPSPRPALMISFDIGAGK